MFAINNLLFCSLNIGFISFTFSFKFYESTLPTGEIDLNLTQACEAEVWRVKLIYFELFLPAANCLTIIFVFCLPESHSRSQSFSFFTSFRRPHDQNKQMIKSLRILGMSLTRKFMINSACLISYVPDHSFYRPYSKLKWLPI